MARSFTRGRASITVRVEGLKELDKALSELPRATQRNVIRKSLLSAAKPFVDHAKRIVPEDTGKLKDAIVAGGKIAAAGKREYADVMRGGGSRAEALSALREARRNAGGSAIEIYAGVSRLAFYAHFVEFGTVKTPPRPFIRPAWDAEKGNMLNIIKREMGERIAKAAARAARKAARNR